MSDGLCHIGHDGVTLCGARTWSGLVTGSFALLDAVADCPECRRIAFVDPPIRIDGVAWCITHGATWYEGDTRCNARPDAFGDCVEAPLYRGGASCATAPVAASARRDRSRDGGDVVRPTVVAVSRGGMSASTPFPPVGESIPWRSSPPADWPDRWPCPTCGPHGEGTVEVPTGERIKGAPVYRYADCPHPDCEDGTVPVHVVPIVEFGDWEITCEPVPAVTVDDFGGAVVMATEMLDGAEGFSVTHPDGPDAPWPVGGCWALVIGLPS